MLDAVKLSLSLKSESDAGQRTPRSEPPSQWASESRDAREVFAPRSTELSEACWATMNGLDDLGPQRFAANCLRIVYNPTSRVFGTEEDGGHGVAHYRGCDIFFVDVFLESRFQPMPTKN